MSSLLPINQALISVYDKSKILNFAQSLSKRGIKLLSTEGTALTLTNSGLVVNKISDYTKLPEIMNGRIKTLHHKICAGILARKGLDDDLINKYDILSIDMVIVDFYPLDFILNSQKHDKEKILEYIDIGGPNMVRAAAKNYNNIVVITNNSDYKNILTEIDTHNGSISLKTRFALASKAFKYITEYDSIISQYFDNQLKIDLNVSNPNIKTHIKPNHSSYFPKIINFMNLKFLKKQNMRYGENPHQKAALYQEEHIQKKTGSIATAQQLQGKPLSYNNIIDMDTALECVKMFNKPTCVIVKHENPCGVASSNTINNAYTQAYQADSISAFGGIIAFNCPLNDKNTAQSIVNQHFVEAIIAPNIHKNCLNILSQKKNIRVLISGMWDNNTQHINNTLNIDFKRISGGLLLQERNNYIIHDITSHLKIVTIRKPTTTEIKDALFCWKIVKFVKSNGIVCGKNYQTTGIGSGQMNRVLAVKIATTLQLNNSPNIQGSVMASDAFFPFPDGIEIAANMGIQCIIQPGGSIQDAKIIDTANKHNISMIFTYTRQFRH